MTAVIELERVARRHAGGVTALEGVDLVVDAGEMVAIVGRSGSGKSTLLNVIGLLDEPTSGVLRIDGEDVADAGDRRRSALRGRGIGFVFQAFHLDQGGTAQENVERALLYAGVPRRLRPGRAREALDRVGLADRVQHRARTLSGGEQQRVAIARALVKQPLILLADEPTGALDSRNGERVLGLLEAANAEGTTVLLVTHDEGVAERLPRRVEIRDGRLVADAARATARA